MLKGITLSLTWWRYSPLNRKYLRRRTCQQGTSSNISVYVCACVCTSVCACACVCVCVPLRLLSTRYKLFHPYGEHSRGSELCHFSFIHTNTHTHTHTHTHAHTHTHTHTRKRERGSGRLAVSTHTGTKTTSHACTHRDTCCHSRSFPGSVCLECVKGRKCVCVFACVCVSF